jgi:hypothetical protein
MKMEQCFVLPAYKKWNRVLYYPPMKYLPAYKNGTECCTTRLWSTYPPMKMEQSVVLPAYEVSTRLWKKNRVFYYWPMKMEQTECCTTRLWKWNSVVLPAYEVPTHLWKWNRQCVPKRWHIKFRRRGITQKKAYDIQNTVKVWNTLQRCWWMCYRRHRWARWHFIASDAYSKYYNLTL